MASVYDNITTAKDLVHEVMAHGLSTKQEDLCKAQDIFGHSTIEELDSLANDIGRNDENGNPDPKGNWSSGRRETRSTFYNILFKIWHYEDATRFWNQHSNPEHDELKTLRTERSCLKKRINELGNHVHELQEETKRSADVIAEQNKHLIEMKNRAEAAEAEIIQLKAKLYDLIAKG